MAAYLKLAVIVLVGIGVQVLIGRNPEAVDEGVFLLRCAGFNLIGSEAERDQLVDHAQQLIDRQRQRFYERVLVKGQHDFALQLTKTAQDAHHRQKWSPDVGSITTQ